MFDKPKHSLRSPRCFEQLEPRQLMAIDAQDVTYKDIGAPAGGWFHLVIDGDPVSDEIYVGWIQPGGQGTTKYPVVRAGKDDTGAIVWRGDNINPAVEINDLYTLEVFGHGDGDYINLSGIDGLDWRSEFGGVTRPVVWVEGGDGMDSIYGSYFGDTIYGEDSSGNLGSYADQLFGGNGSDVLRGGGGNDSIDGQTGPDYIYGDGDNDALNGGDDWDQIYGGAGDDELTGGDGQDTLHGDAGTDTLYGDDFAESEYAAPDLLAGGDGNDSIFGGGGGDSIWGDNYNSTVVSGSAHEDVIRGDYWNSASNEEADWIDGQFGDDVIVGQGGDDTLSGGASHFTASVTLESGNDVVSGGDGYDIIQGHEGNDHLDGGNQDDSIVGGAGADTIWGEEGCDTLYGDAGADSINGGPGDDSGDAGADNKEGDGLVDGGSGKDTIPPELTNDPDDEENCEEGFGPQMLQGGPVLLSDNIVGYRDQRISLGFLAILNEREFESYLRYYRMTDEEVRTVRRWRNLFLADSFAELAALWTSEADCGCGDWSM